MVTIRNFCDKDAPQLWQIFFNTIRTVNLRDYSEAQVRAWARDDVEPEHWLEKMRAIQPFVAELDNCIVGYTDLQNDGLIDHFFCHQDYQGKGAGKALMHHVFAQASRRDIHTLHSHVSITAKPFYQRLGFVVMQEQSMAAGAQTLVNYLMKKNLKN